MLFRSIFAKLYDWVEKRLGLKGLAISYKWSGQIVEPMDSLAYIGKNPGEKNVYIATGDSGQGITHGAIAGMLLSSLIAGEIHPWAEIYDPARFKLKSLNYFIKENTQTGIQYADWVYRDDKSLNDLNPGEGTVITKGLDKIAVFKDKEGDLHKLSAVCPHLGGVVKWNSAEETWDCPCHGSRFSRMGEVINGPALHDMKPHIEREQEESPIKKKDSDNMDTFFRGSR